MKKLKKVFSILLDVFLFVLLICLNLVFIYLIELLYYLGRFFPYVFIAFLPALLLGRLSRRSFKRALVRGVLPFLTALTVYTLRIGARSGWLRFGGWFLDLWWVIALYLAGLAAFMYFGWFCRFRMKIVRRWAVPALSLLLLFLTAMQAYSFFTGLIGKFSSVPDIQNKSYGEALRDLCDCLEREYPYFAYKKIDWPKIKERTLASLPEIKTDDDFARLVIGLVNELQDGHLRARPRTWKSDLKDKASLGARFVHIDGTLVIAEVIPKSGAAEAGLKPGMVLCRVNGRPVGEVLAGVPDYAINSKSGSIRGERKGVLHRLTWLLTQRIGTTFVLTFRGLDDLERNYEVKILPTKIQEPELLSFKRLEQGFGYIRIPRFSMNYLGLIERFDKALEEFWDTEGIIIDFRGNPGGIGILTDPILGRLTDRKVYYGGIKCVPPKRISLYVVTRRPIYRKKVAVLIDELGVSATELVSYAASHLDRITLIGRPTAGVVSSPSQQTIRLPGGVDVPLFRGGLTDREGRYVVEWTGVQPDIFIPYTLEAIRSGQDRDLQTAVEHLRKKE